MTKIHWRRLKQGEVIQEGDYWASFDMNKPDFRRWVERVESGIDKTVARQYIEIADGTWIGQPNNDKKFRNLWAYWRPVGFETDEQPESEPINKERKIDLDL